MDTWIVFMDMDNTLTDKSEIVPGNLDAILRAQRAGHKIVLNSGRSYGFLPKKVLAEVPFDAVIAGGGAYVRVGDTVLLNKYVPEEVLRKLCDYFVRTGIACYFEGVDESYCINTTREGFTTIHSYADIHGMTSKITIISLRERTLPPEGLALIEQYFVYIRHPNYSEGILKGCSKSGGMRICLDYFGIPRERCMAIGDSANDLDMLDYAGLSVAVANSTPEVLACVDAVTESCTDAGVARAIDRFILLQ